MRKITSLTAALSFVFMLVTSIILYVVPQGRVAYWADWHLWGLTKTQWGNLHINLGLLFFIALFLHIYYNWKPLMAYLKSKARQFKLFTKAFNIAFAVTLVCALGTYLMLPPFSWVMILNDHFKDAGAARYGEPPYGHAELSSLATFTRKMGLDLEKSMALLDKAGYPAENANLTLADLGRLYNVPPQKIYQAIATVADAKEDNRAVPGLPDSPPPGTGNMTLTQLCRQYDIDRQRVVNGLIAAGLSLSVDLPLKKTAAENNMSPVDLFERIRLVAIGAFSSENEKDN